MYCGDCGANNVDTARFCVACGRPLLAVAPPPPMVPPPVPPPTTTGGVGRGLKVALMVAGVAAVGLILVVVAFGSAVQHGARGPGSSNLDGTAVTKRVYIGEVPSYVSDPVAVRSAVEAGINEWSTRGYHIEEVTNSSQANVQVQFIKEWGTETLGQTYSESFVQVGLGDSQCNQKWTPYAASSLHWIATHEFGHSLGKGHSTDPNDVMYPTFLAHYAVPCEIMSGDYNVSPGGRAYLGFHTGVNGTISYNATELEGGTMDVGLIAAKDGDAYLNGTSVDAWAYHQRVNQETDGATLPAGKYALAIQCDNRSVTCVVHYVVSEEF